MWRQRLRIFFHNKLAVASVVFFITRLAVCFLVPASSTRPIRPTRRPRSDVPWNAAAFVAPLLGTDSSGFDELGRIFYGGEYSLSLGFLAGFITIVVGTHYGMIAGFARRRDRHAS